MKKLWLLLFALPLLAACSQPTAPAATEAYNRYIYDSAWNLVRATTAKALAARDATSDATLQAEVTAYNAAHTDDQYFLEDAEVPIDEAPTADIYIVKGSDHSVIYEEFHGWPRSDLAERRDVWRLEAQGRPEGVLYVDNVPPTPVPVVDTRTPAEKWNVYLIAADGSIIMHEVCDTKDQFDYRVYCYKVQATQDGNGEYELDGAVYTPPST